MRPSTSSPALDLVVVGNAISRGNPELEAVLERRLRYCSLPEAIRDSSLGAPRRSWWPAPRQDHHDLAHRLAADARRARSHVLVGGSR
jgi:hypothetical protein